MFASPIAPTLAASNETRTGHRGGIIGKVESVIHGISDRLHPKHGSQLHRESEVEHGARTGTIGESYELGPIHPEKGLGRAALGGLSAGLS